MHALVGTIANVLIDGVWSRPGRRWLLLTLLQGLRARRQRLPDHHCGVLEPRRRDG